MHKSGTWKAFIAGTLLAGLSAPAWGAIPAHPGMLNYVEGNASINGDRVTSGQVGLAEVAPGQVLDTESGKAEILLTPGVFLRLGEHSSLRIDAAGLTNTAVELIHGQAMVEAADLKEQNKIRILDRGLVTTLEKNGLYRFDADQAMVAVYDGKAQVRENDRTADVKKGKQVSAGNLKTTKFDRGESDDLYNWSKLRSQYLSEASAASARTYAVGGVWPGGWYWNPYYSFYSYLPGAGYLYSPFGYGFYSPLYLRSALAYRHYGAGYYRGNGYRAAIGSPRGGFGRASGFGAPHGGGGFGRNAARR